jgi:hypothetical protein
MASDVRDFGEYLVDIRDQLAVELPMRVNPRRVFFGALTESFSLITLRVFRLEFYSVIKTRPDPDELLNPMMEKFRSLKDIRVSHIQVEQTQTLYVREMHRRTEHIDHEMALWTHAITSGLYIGMLALVLFLLSIIMSVITDRVAWNIPIGMGFFILQALCALVTSRGWLCR